MRTAFFLLSAALAAPLAAQTEGPESAASVRVLEEIVVTATRRERSVMEVPLAVSAYSAAQLEMAGVSDINHLMRLAPSVHLATGQGETVGATVRIRGIGTNADTPGFESAVGLYVDGVYRNRAGVGYNELGAVERIEILRGPQGTLFGRNASAGVVSIITAGPDAEGSAYADIGVGSYDENRVEAGLSGGSAAGLAARLDGVWHERSGFLTDANDGRSYNDRDRLFLRGQLLYQPGSDISARLIADHTTREEVCCAAVGVVRGATAALVQGVALAQTRNPSITGIAFDPEARKATVSSSSGYYQGVDESGLSVEIKAATRLGALTSITAFRDWQTQRGMDIDFSVADIGERPHGESVTGFETFTQELRLNGTAGPVDWLVGVFFADEKLDYTDVLEFRVGYSPYANEIARQVTSGLGGAFAQLGASAPALEVGAAQVAAGAGAFAAGLAPVLPPGLAVPNLAASLPSFPAFPFDPWRGYEQLSGGEFPGRGTLDDFSQNSESWAIFTHNSIALANDFELTVGLRYTAEDKSLDASLQSSDQVCQPFSARVLGYLQTVQTYLGGVGGYAAGLTRYLQQLDGFVDQATQAIPIPAVQQQIEQGAAQVKAGARQVLPGAAALAQGGQALLTDPAVSGGVGQLVAFACLPFVDPSLDGQYAGAIDESQLSGTLRLSRQMDGYLLYGGYSRGYKAGGFNMDRAGLLSPVLTLLATGTANVPSVEEWIVPPETVDAFELGAKLEFENRRAALDLNVFHEKFEGFQLTSFTGLAFEAQSIPEVISRGVEVEARGVVADGLELFGGVTYADVRYGEGPEYGVRSGRQMTHAPRWTGVGGATLRFPVGPLAGALHLDARYNSDHNTGSDLDAEKLQPAYTVVNLRLLLERPGASAWTLDVWARNLFNENYFVTVFDAPLQGSGTGAGSTQTFNAFLGSPREYGIGFRYEFH